MVVSDRANFDQRMMVLCAGFPPMIATSERIEAYWTGLQKMPFPQFVRCVEFTLSEDGPEKIPTPKQLWQLYRKLRQGVATNRPTTKPDVQLHDYVAFANRCLYKFLRDTEGVSTECLVELIATKNKIAKAFIVSGFDESENPALVIREKLLQALRRVRLVKITPQELEHARAGHKRHAEQEKTAAPVPDYSNEETENLF